MAYTKPTILDTRSAQEAIKGHNKLIEMADAGVQGTSTAYEADE